MSQGKVVTFYSYKGGVGRTQAVANVAAALVRAGKRVRLVDLDLESPGLRTYFTPPSGDASADMPGFAEESGFLEFIEAARKLPEEPPQIRNFLVELQCEFGTLELLNPGRFDEDYPARIARFSWERFYEEEYGYGIMEVFREQILEGVDFVLIDSRTGMTDIAGICTFQLPDIVVMLFALHDQGIEGIRRVATKIKERRESEETRVQDILLIPSRVEYNEQALRTDWLSKAEVRLEGLGQFVGELDRLFRYETHVAYGERIVVGDGTDLANAYQFLVEQLAPGGQAAPDLPGQTWADLDKISEGLTFLAAELMDLIRDAELQEQNLDSLTSWTGQLRDSHRGLLRSAADLRACVAAIEIVGDRPLSLPYKTPRTAEGWGQLADKLLDLVEACRLGWSKDWLLDFSVRAEQLGLEGEGLDGTMSELDKLLRAGDLPRAKAMFEDFAQKHMLAARVKEGSLDRGDLQRYFPEVQHRLRRLETWRQMAIEVWLQSEKEVGLAALRNLLLLRSLEEEPLEPVWWEALEVVSEKDPVGRPALFESCGARMWRQAWLAYFDSGSELPSGDALSRMLKNLAQEITEPFDELARFIAGRLGNPAARGDRPQLTHLFCERRFDPLLHRAVCATGDTTLSSLWWLEAGRSKETATMIVSAVSVKEPAAALAFSMAAQPVVGATWTDALEHAVLHALDQRAWLFLDEWVCESTLPALTPRTLARCACSPAHLAAAVVLDGANQELIQDAGTKVFQRVFQLCKANPQVNAADLVAVERLLKEIEAKLQATSFQPGLPQHGRWMDAFRAHWTGILNSLGETKSRQAPLSFGQWLSSAIKSFKQRGGTGARREVLKKKIQPSFTEVQELIGQLEAALSGLGLSTAEQLLEAVAKLSSTLTVTGPLNELESRSIPEELWQVDEVLVQRKGEQLLVDLPRWHLGERTPEEAFEAYLRASSLKEAERCLELIGEGASEEQKERLYSRIGARLDNLRADLEVLGLHLEKLRAAGGDAELLAEAKQYIEQSRAKAGATRLARGADLFLGERLWDHAKQALDVVEDALKEQEWQIKRAFDEALEQVRRYLVEFAVSVDDESQVLTVTRLIQALRSSRSEELLSLTSKALSAEDPMVALEELSPGGQMQPLLSASLREESSEPRISALALKEFSRMAGTDPSKSGFSDVVTPAGGPWLGWDRGKLQQRRQSYAEALYGIPLAKLLRREEALEYLLCSAKVALLDLDPLRSQLYYGDLLHLLGTRPRGGKGHERWLKIASVGFIVTFLLPHLSKRAAERIATPGNLVRLFTRPVEHFSLKLFTDLGLWEPFGHELAAVGGEGAARVIRLHLPRVAALDLHAAGELGSGMLSVQREAVHVGPLLRELIRLLPSTEALQIPELEPRGDTVRYMSELVEQCPVNSPTNLVLSNMLEATVNAHKGALLPSQARVSLVTRNLGPHFPTRIVLQVTPDEVQQTIRAVRAEVSLVTKSGARVCDLEMPPVLPWVRYGERRDIVVQAGEEELQAADQVAVQLYEPHDGVWRVISRENRKRRFSYTIREDAVSAGTPNPYVAGLALMNPSQIFGREEVVSRVWQQLVGKQQDNVVLLLGDRRIGKSTVLNLIQTSPIFRDRYAHIVVLNLENFAKDSIGGGRSTSRKFFDHIRLGVEKSLGAKISGLGVDEFQQFSDFISKVDALLEAKSERSLLIFDELDHLFELIEQQDVPREAMATLRAATHQSQRISVVFAGETRILKRHLDRAEGRLFQLGLQQEIGPLSEEASRGLIEVPSQDQFRFAPEARDQLIEDTGKQPYLIQLVCNRIFLDAQEKGLVEYTVPDLEQLYRVKILPDESLFTYLVTPWRAQAGDYEILLALAAADPRQRRRVEGTDSARRFVSVDQLHFELDRRIDEGAPTLEQLARRLRSLAQDLPSTLEKSSSPRDAYRIRIGLLTRHLRRAQYDLMWDWVLDA